MCITFSWLKLHESHRCNAIMHITTVGPLHKYSIDILFHSIFLLRQIFQRNQMLVGSVNENVDAGFCDVRERYIDFHFLKSFRIISSQCVSVFILLVLLHPLIRRLRLQILNTTFIRFSRSISHDQWKIIYSGNFPRAENRLTSLTFCSPSLCHSEK